MLKSIKSKYIRRLGLFVVLVMAVAFPLTHSNLYVTYVATLCCAWALLAESWDILTGYAGQVSFGQAGFFAVGAYASAILSMQLGMSAWVGLFLGGAISMIVGTAVAMPCLRLERHYLALVTLGFSEIVRIILVNWTEVTRGPMGFWGYPTFEGVPLPITYATRVYLYYIALAILLLSTFIMWWTGERTSIGLRFKAIRENATLSATMGINTTMYRTLSFAMSAFFAGLAGSLYAHNVLLVSPPIAGVDITSIIIAMAVIGGIGTIAGPILGAVVVVFVQELMRLTLGVVFNLIAVGAVLIVFTIVFPQGLMGLIKKRSRT